MPVSVATTDEVALAMKKLQTDLEMLAERVAALEELVTTGKQRAVDTNNTATQ